jgi:hypothetical protein
MPTISLTDDELAAVTAALRSLIEDDKYPHAPRLDPLRAALGKFEAEETSQSVGSLSKAPKAPPTAKDKRGGA